MLIMYLRMRKYSTSSKSKKSTKKPLVIAGTCLAVVVIATGTYLFVHNRNKSTANTDTTGQINPEDINYNPPTETDKNEVDANKQNVSNQINNDNQGSSGTQKTVTPVITSPVPTPASNSTQVRIGAYIPGIFEDGGTCTATIKGASNTTQKSTGFKNVSTTDCEPMNVTLTPGQWTVTLSYESATAKGQSSPVTFKVE